ncbi:hypothetical protein ACHAC9_08045 [Massilia sp. CMS3.1]|uniref:hypothetical protein n=1 Tax=Massilia sp. CMS3.1 TaxID=3373083 RepID=UPI003EE45FDA
MKSVRRCFLAFCVLLTAMTCHASEPIVDGRGVGNLLIGEAPPRLLGKHLVSREWQEDENGERYESLKARVEGIPVEAEVYDGRIWRITVMRRGLRTRDGSQVGDSVHKLIHANPSLHREIGPGPRLVLIPENFCGISYTTDADLPESVMNNLNSELPTQFARNTHIHQILVTGCEI